MTLRLYPDALTELETLKNLAPEEANVFFLLGKCYKGLGQRASAVRAFTTALNLDAKVSFCSRFAFALPFIGVVGLTTWVHGWLTQVFLAGGAVYQGSHGGPRRVRR